MEIMLQQKNKEYKGFFNDNNSGVGKFSVNGAGWGWNFEKC